MEGQPNQAESAAPEKQSNCPACGKQIKRVKRYYRNNKYYCNKQCFRKVNAVKKEQGSESK